MKKKLTLWILLCPIVLLAQTGVGKDGTITIDFGKKKKQQDTVQVQDPDPYRSDEDKEEEIQKPKKEKKPSVVKEEKEEAPDFRKDGLFQGLFAVGINGCQVDGDSYAGYNYPGLEANVGVMLRFHKNLSTSMEMGYSMKGARQAFVFNPAPPTTMKYRSQWDYIQVPIGLNIHDNRVVIFSIGVAPSILVRFTERDENGDDITGKNPFLAGEEPRRFDLPAFAAMHFIFKKHFTVGLKFAYSVTPSRGSFNRFGSTRLSGQHHNVFTLRFMYILSATKKK